MGQGREAGRQYRFGVRMVGQDRRRVRSFAANAQRELRARWPVVAGLMLVRKPNRIHRHTNRKRDVQCGGGGGVWHTGAKAHAAAAVVTNLRADKDCLVRIIKSKRSLVQWRCKCKWRCTCSRNKYRVCNQDEQLHTCGVAWLMNEWRNALNASLSAHTNGKIVSQKRTSAHGLVKT